MQGSGAARAHANRKRMSMSTNEPQDSSTYKTIYEKFALINRCDERFRSAITSGRAAMIYYPVRGQELPAACMNTALEEGDYVVTTYRGIGDHVGKGVPLDKLWAELLGRVDGSCKGKGGPMHITHPETGIMVTTGIVGSGLPIGLGFALASQVRGDGKVTSVTFGDGASNIGAFHEALNMASVWKLPIVFFCLNNTYAEHTTFEKGTSCAQIADRAVAYGMPGVRVNGNDPVETYAACKEAVERARAGGGPTLIEAMTYRFKGHSLGSTWEYMPKDKYAAAEAADPLKHFRPWMIEQGHASEDELAAIEADIESRIDSAIEFGFASPWPDASEVLTDVIAQEKAA
jgi:pyruvate dehydrogenase E1 component alpha subunit